MAKDELVGSIEKRGDKYRLRVTVGYNEKGNPIRKSKLIDVPNARRAYAELDQWIEDLEEHGYVDVSNITLKYFVENMWKSQAPLLMEPRTYQSYLDIVDARIIPKFGDKLLCEIKPFEIRSFILDQKKLKKPTEDLSRETKKRILAAFSSLYNIAEQEFRIVKNNPCTGLKLPKKTKEDRIKKGVQPPYSLDELDELFLHLSKASLRVQAIILTAFVTGAREGEIAALERKHFSFEKLQVTFEQRIVKVRGEKSKRIDGLKNGTELIVDVPLYYLNVMNLYFNELDQKRNSLLLEIPKHDYVFGHIDGQPISPATLYRVWEKFVKSNGLRMIRFHDLRHSAASFLIATPNISDKAVQEHLGHSDYRTTMNMYVHGMRESKRQIANVMEDLISGNNNKESNG